MPQTSTFKTQSENIRIGGKLKEIITLRDEKGNIIQRIIAPLMVEFYFRDVLQVIVGASLLAIPIAFTEEVWNLGAALPLMNVVLLGLLSVVFIAIFVFHNFYQDNVGDHKAEFFKRVLAIYLISCFVVALILTLIQRAPWEMDTLLAVKRTILVAFPASMSAAVADMIK